MKLAQLAVVLVLGWAGAGFGVETMPAADLSTPEKTLESWAWAKTYDDGEAMANLTAWDDAKDPRRLNLIGHAGNPRRTERELMALYETVFADDPKTAAFVAEVRVGYEKWMADAIQMQKNSPPVEKMTTKKMEGGIAVFTTEVGGRVFKLKQVGNEWKLLPELFSPRPVSQNQPNPEEFQKRFEKFQAEMLEQTYAQFIADVKAKKFATLADARYALDIRLGEVQLNAFKAAKKSFLNEKKN